MKQLASIFALFLLKASCHGFVKHQNKNFSTNAIRQLPREYLGTVTTCSSFPLQIQQRHDFVPRHRISPVSFRLAVVPALPLECFALGIAWVVLPYFVRIASAERAWEERLEKARQKREEETGRQVSNIEFYQQSVSTYPSMYGPDGALERKRKAALRMKEGKEEELEDEEEDDTALAAQERLAFEKEFGLEYDPNYDDPLLEEELPTNEKYIKLSAFGDRMYQDGRVFFKDGDVYFRRGAKPRIRSFWETR